MKVIPTLLTITVAAGFASNALALDAAAVLKKSGCMTCHSVSAKKDGPSFKSVAEKYKGKAEGEKAVTDQITASTSHPHHLKTKDAAQIKSVVQYILSR